jgi:hypothetical protein
MKWEKKGVIFCPSGDSAWMVTHVSIPVVDVVENSRLRLYFGTRDNRNRSFPGYLEVDAADPSRVLYVHSDPVLTLGPSGSFDDSGIMPSWIVDVGEEKFLYYIGWNQGVIVPYQLAIGLAVSRDGGRTFAKLSSGPICDRGLDDPYFCTTPCVLREETRWRMWYTSCTGWEEVLGRYEPRYHVKYAESTDGIRWSREGTVCIGYDNFTEAIARPCVYRHAGAYRMLYSYRNLTNYRTDPGRSYRLGYARSEDGIRWERCDEAVGITRSREGWDSEMIEYCYTLRVGATRYLFYNGNGFGKTGVGYAILRDE